MPGIDFKLFKIPGYPTTVYDIGLNLDGDFITEDAFDTSIIVSFGTDGRASISEMKDASRRRGWAGDLILQGAEMGGLVWLWFQSRLEERETAGLSKALAETLVWLKEDGWVNKLPRVSGTPTGTKTAEVVVDITKPSGEVERRYFDLWKNTGDTIGS